MKKLSSKTKMYHAYYTNLCQMITKQCLENNWSISYQQCCYFESSISIIIHWSNVPFDSHTKR